MNELKESEERKSTERQMLRNLDEECSSKSNPAAETHRSFIQSAQRAREQSNGQGQPRTPFLRPRCSSDAVAFADMGVGDAPGQW